MIIIKEIELLRVINLNRGIDFCVNGCYELAFLIYVTYQSDNMEDDLLSFAALLELHNKLYRYSDYISMIEILKHKNSR